MVKVRILAILATVMAVAACGLTSVATGSAYETVHWAGNGYSLASGQNGFLNRTRAINESWGKGENRAVCSGLRGISDSCVGRGSTASYHTQGYIYVYLEAYLHNHDTEAGYFAGWYFGEF
jgi:hypothetical protein